MRKKILFVMGILFGLMMLNAGLNKFFNYIPMPKDLPADFVQMMTTFMQLGWLMPLIAMAEIVGGILFMIPKYRALGAIIILPVMVGILLLCIFQSPQGIAMAVILFGINIWAIAEEWNKYLPMIR